MLGLFLTKGSNLSSDATDGYPNLLVIGGDSSISQSIVSKAANAGWNVIASTRSSVKRPEPTPTSQERFHPAEVNGTQESFSKKVFLDLESEVSVRSFVTDLVRGGIKLDGVVFAGAVAHGGRIGMVSDEQIERVLRVNLVSWMSLSQRLVRLMRSPSSIVFISSDSAHTAIAANFLYGASKAAIERFAQSLSLELADRGVRVNCVSPTLVETPMLEEMDVKSRVEVLSRARAERMLSPEEVAASILFLLSCDSSAINGQTRYLGKHAH